MTARSLFRPDRLPDPAILDDHRKLLDAMARRRLLRGGLSLGSLVALTGCDPTSSPSVESAVLALSRVNDWVGERLFDPTRLAPT